MAAQNGHQNNPSVHSVLTISDTPDDWGAPGQVLVVNPEADGMAWADNGTGGGGAESFLGLTDTPDTYGGAGNVPITNIDSTGLGWYDLSEFTTSVQNSILNIQNDISEIQANSDAFVTKAGGNATSNYEEGTTITDWSAVAINSSTPNLLAGTAASNIVFNVGASSVLGEKLVSVSISATAAITITITGTGSVVYLDNDFPTSLASGERLDFVFWSLGGITRVKILPRA